MNKKVHIFAGGTLERVAPHLSLCCPAFGTVGKQLFKMYEEQGKLEPVLHLSKLASPTDYSFISNLNLKRRVLEVKEDSSTKIVVMAAGVTDFDLDVYDEDFEMIAGKRLDSSRGYLGRLNPAEKILPLIRDRDHKHIFVVGFKTTYDANKRQMWQRGMGQIKSSSVNLTLVNDIKTRQNMIVTPEEGCYEFEDREQALSALVKMSLERSNLTFTQSSVISGTPVKWESDLIPKSLREVVNFCIDKNAYKLTGGSTAGHFAYKISDDEFLTSIRRTDFNEIDRVGMVRVKTDGPDTVMAYGAKPSVGGQSQRTVFRDHPGMDCIVHFHCPLKENPLDKIPTASQAEFECGSHQCGENTSANLGEFADEQIKCVYLDKHGPNIVFNSKIDPAIVKGFILTNFELSERTSGY